MVPPIKRAMIWIASPTDFICVVLVVLKPISRMMIVEKEVIAPFGIALFVSCEYEELALFGKWVYLRTLRLQK